MTNDKHSRFSLVIAVGACVGIALVIAGVMFLFLNNRPSAQPLLAQGTAIQSVAQPLLLTASPVTTLAQTTPTPTATQSLLPTVRPDATLALPHDPTQAAERRQQYQFLSNYNDVISVYGIEYQGLFIYSTDAVSRTGNLSIPAQVAPNPLSVFATISTRPLSFTLTMPDGRLLTPELAANDPLITYTAKLRPGEGFFTQYIIRQPIPGTWQAHIQRHQADIAILIGFDLLPFKLATAGEDEDYLPGDQIKFTAVLEDEAKPGIIKHSTITGSITYDTFSNSQATRSFTFADDGTNGDRVAGDGEYTAQFPAENVPGLASYTITAANGLVTRMKSSHISITDLRTLRKTAAFVPNDQTHQIVTASMPDTDGDGFGDALDLTASFVVSETGLFDISGTLNHRTSFQVYTTTLLADDHQIQLEPGRHTLTLRFNGIGIRSSGIQGPYTLQELVLSDRTTGEIVEVDARTDIFTTTPAQEIQFKGPPLQWIQTSEQSIDSDGNGIPDMLWIDILFDAVQPGDYLLSGRLVDSEQHTIAMITNERHIEDRGYLDAHISGADIKANGRDGPYRLVDLHVRQTSNIIDNQPIDMILSEVYTTAPFKVSQFEAAAPTPTPQPTDATPQPTAQT